LTAGFCVSGDVDEMVGAVGPLGVTVFDGATSLLLWPKAALPALASNSVAARIALRMV
jgi:hypothetical protein